MTDPRRAAPHARVQIAPEMRACRKCLSSIALASDSRGVSVECARYGLRVAFFDSETSQIIV